VASSIAEQILGQITNGSIPVGARLPSEETLARDFEVSRPTVREALAALQFAGHVESRRGSGTLVLNNEAAPRDPIDRQPLASLTEAVDLLETRILIEPQALAAAAVDPDREALRAARELIGGMHLAVDDPELHATTDIRVHRALLAVCRNKFLRDAATDLLDLAIDPMMLTARTQAWASSELPHMWADQHDVVWVALANGNARGAQVGCLAHLASVVENLAAATSDTPELSRRMDALFVKLAEAGVTGRGRGQASGGPRGGSNR